MPGFGLRATTGRSSYSLAEADEKLWRDVTVDGFAHPDESPTAHEIFPREVLDDIFITLGRTSGFRRYVARIDGDVAGIGEPADRRRHRAACRRGHAAGVQAPRGADGAASSPFAGSTGRRLHAVSRDDSARFYVTGQRATSRICFALHTRDPGEKPSMNRALTNNALFGDPIYNGALDDAVGVPSHQARRGPGGGRGADRLMRAACSG